MRVMFAASIMVGLVATASPAAWAQGSAAHDLSGVWWIEKPPQSLLPANGSPVPFTPAGRTAYEAYRAGVKAGTIVDTTSKYCLPDGTPRLLTAPFPFEVVQTAGQVTFLHEARHVYRAVPLDGTHTDAKLLIEGFMGNPAGHWEGDVLVIDSIGFNTETRLDSAGLPHSGDLRVTERWQRIDGGKRLRVDVTIADPQMYSAAWSARLTFALRNDVTIEEYVCGQKHRNTVQSRGAK